MRALLVFLCTSALAFTACTPDSPTPPPAPTALANHASSSQSARSDAPRTVSSASEERSLDQRLEDARTEARVTRALVRDPALTLYDFSVRVTSGRLTLEGDVNTQRQHEAIERVLRRVSGIGDVENRVTIAGRAVGESEKASEIRASADIDGTPTSEERSSQGAYYTVESGDTLWNIAQRHQASIQRIKSLNRLDGSSLQPGQRIRVR